MKADGTLDRCRTAWFSVRSLGLSAPVRAAYELSKRAGGHRAVFMGLARRQTRRGHVPVLQSPPSPMAWASGVGPDVRQRTIASAQQVCAEGALLFGRRVRLDSAESWHALVEEPGTWPRQPWWGIDIRSPTRAADVKWVWELGRQAHVVLLARAVAVAPERTDFQRELERQLRSFLEQNPPEIGIHWYSNLELAIRVLRWREVLSATTLPLELEAGLASVVQHTQNHLLADLPYTLSTMRNNHLLGDGLGLQGCASLTGHRWPRRVGNALFDWQLRRHIRENGATIEDSLSYHRFVLEMLAMRCGLPAAGPHHVKAMVGSAQALARLGALDGPVPQYGDWDEGRVLVSSQDPADVRGTVRLALALGGTGAAPGWRDQHDECFWYSPDGVPVVPDAAVTDGSDVGLGIARASAGGFTTWLKAGGGVSHGHADYCSVAILGDGVWLIGDPGTGTYNGAPAVRGYFRSSIAHSVLRVEGTDQRVPNRVFGWRYAAQGAVGTPVSVSSGSLAWAAHNAYCRLRPPRRVARTVLTVPDGVVVADWIEGGDVAYAISLPLGPAVDIDPDDLATTATGLEVGGRRYRLVLPSPASARRGQVVPMAGWWSTTYGSRTPSWCLEVSGHQPGPIVWAILRPGADVPTVDGAVVRFHRLSWQVVWDREWAALSVGEPGRPRSDYPSVQTGDEPKSSVEQLGGTTRATLRLPRSGRELSNPGVRMANREGLKWSAP